MDSFKKFIESMEDSSLRNTRADAGTDTGIRNAKKDANMAYAQRLMQTTPQITVKQLIDNDDEHSKALADMIEFSERYRFDQSIPLHTLILIYARHAK